MNMKISIRMSVATLVAAAGFAGVGQAAAPPAEIVIPGERLITESLTSSADGTVYVGSMLGKTIFKAAPGSAKAEAWIKPGTNGLQGIFGVFADDKSNTLYACSGNPPGPPQPGVAPAQSALHAFDLKSGAPKGKWDLPTPNATCNDIAVDAAGNAYATDTGNNEVVLLKKGASKLEVWAGANDAYGPKGSILDGIAILGDKVLVNALRTGKLFVTPIGKDGKAGKVSEVKLDRALAGPDGQRSFGKSSLLVAEGTAPGKLSRVDLTGADLATGKITVIKEGYPDGPVAVTVVGDTAYVLEGQLGIIMGPPGAAPAAPKPFKATAVEVGKAP
jgi:sugar lactone lactonase YvrE